MSLKVQTYLNYLEEALSIFWVHQSVVENPVNLVHPQPDQLTRVCSADSRKQKNSLKRDMSLKL